MDKLTDDELKAELRRALRLGDIASNHGEMDAAIALQSLHRALDTEIRNRAAR